MKHQKIKSGKIEIMDSGHVYRNGSAFPTLVRLNNGDIICGFSVGDGPNATGGTDWSRSRDGGKTWTREGTILPVKKTPFMANSLRLSRTRDEVIIAYGARYCLVKGKNVVGEHGNEPVFCLSCDQGRSWSDPQVICTDSKGPLEITEISNPILEVSDGRWLAPAAISSDKNHLCDSVIAFESADKGLTWPVTRTVFRDPDHKKSYFEQKLMELEPGVLLAVTWTVSTGDYKDFEDHFALSKDGGCTWGAAMPTGIWGQTMNPFWLGDDCLLVVYNRRYGAQGILICLVRFTATAWEVETEQFLWNPGTIRSRKPEQTSGINEFDDFAFGLPSVLRLDDHCFLAVHWCKEDGIFGIRWTKLRLS